MPNKLAVYPSMGGAIVKLPYTASVIIVTPTVWSKSLILEINV